MKQHSYYMSAPILDSSLPCFVAKREEAISYITIHETSLGTEKVPAFLDADYYIEKLRHPKQIADGSLTTIGFHYLVEAEYNKYPIVYHLIPDDVITHHCGPFGNKVSVGIERLVNERQDNEKAVSAQAELTANLMLLYNISIDHVVPHKFWSPSKECPGRLLAGLYGGWDGFIQKVTYHFDRLKGD